MRNKFRTEVSFEWIPHFRLVEYQDFPNAERIPHGSEFLRNGFRILGLDDAANAPKTEFIPLSLLTDCETAQNADFSPHVLEFVPEIFRMRTGLAGKKGKISRAWRLGWICPTSCYQPHNFYESKSKRLCIPAANSADSYLFTATMKKCPGKKGTTIEG